MWQGIRGHEGAVKQFREALAAGRLATTYLFVGPEGVGKRSFAQRLAKVLLCTVADEASLEPCGKCESCRLADAGTHPDLHVIAREAGTKFLKIEYFIGDREHRHREGLCFELALKPYVGRRRVAIIDDADWLNIESANALLKTLEEPPPGSVIILVGTSRSRQLPTILSRSQVVRFGPLAENDLAELILGEGIAGEAAAAQALATRSEGTLARARNLSDAALGEICERLARQWLAGRIDGVRTPREIDELVAAAGKEADVRRQRIRQIFQLTSDALRDELRRRATADSQDGLIDPLMGAIDRTLEAEEQLDRNANQSTLLECWLDDLARLRDGAAIGAGM